MRTWFFIVVLVLAGVAGWRWLRPAEEDANPAMEPAPVVEPAPAETARAPEIVRVVPPSSAVRTVIQAFGCEESTPPTLGGLGDAANLVQSELWDRALAIFRASTSSADLRDGLREIFTREGDVDGGLERIARAPDRVDEGFDHATSAAFTAALRAMGECAASDSASRSCSSERAFQTLPPRGKARVPPPSSNASRSRALADRFPCPRSCFEDAERWIAWIDAQDPESPHAPLARAVRARYAGDDYAERDGLRESLRRDGEQPGVALTLALREMRIGMAADALQALNQYTEVAAEENEWVSATRPRLERAAELESTMELIVDAGVSVLYPPQLDVHDAWRVHGIVVESLDEAAQLFRRPRRPQLLVVIYGTRADFHAVTCGPRWSGARYDGSLRVPGSLVGGAFERHILRHESLHAQLSHLAPNAPLWLHEGLAQRFEERETRAMQRTFRTMQRARTYVPFPSLEGSFLVIDDADAARFAYHQSYAMVQAWLENEPDAMARAVRHLRTGGEPSELLGVMRESGLDGDALLSWVDRNIE